MLRAANKINIRTIYTGILHTVVLYVTIWYKKYQCDSDLISRKQECIGRGHNMIKTIVHYLFYKCYRWRKIRKQNSDIHRPAQHPAANHSPEGFTRIECDFKDTFSKSGYPTYQSYSSTHSFFGGAGDNHPAGFNDCHLD